MLQVDWEDGSTLKRAVELVAAGGDRYLVESQEEFDQGDVWRVMRDPEDRDVRMAGTLVATEGELGWQWGQTYTRTATNQNACVVRLPFIANGDGMWVVDSAECGTTLTLTLT